jgi:hypothetical protein
MQKRMAILVSFVILTDDNCVEFMRANFEVFDSSKGTKATTSKSILSSKPKKAKKKRIS